MTQSSVARNISKNSVLFQFGLAYITRLILYRLCCAKAESMSGSFRGISDKIIDPQVETFVNRHYVHAVFRLRPLMWSAISDVPIKRKTTEGITETGQPGTYE